MARKPTTTKKAPARTASKTTKATKIRTSKLAPAPARTRPTPTQQYTQPHNRFDYRTVSAEDLFNHISLAQGVELDFGTDEKAMRRYRSRLYMVNKVHAGKWRYRSLRDGSLLMIWRLA